MNPLITFIKYLSNLDLKLSTILELITDAGSLFQWSTTLTLKYDLRATVLYHVVDIKREEEKGNLKR